MTPAGRCRCRAVSYTLDTQAPIPVYACHCLDCQTWSGSAFALHALLAGNAIAVDGPVTDYRYEADGQASHHRLCSICHTRLYNTTTAAPGMLVLRAGTLEDSASVQPFAHIWVRHKQPWLNLPDGIAVWPENPTAEAFAEALRASSRPC